MNRPILYFAFLLGLAGCISAPLTVLTLALSEVEYEVHPPDAAFFDVDTEVLFPYVLSDMP
jgi:hypothetical protein